MTYSHRFAIALVSLIAACTLPLLVLAQEADLRATIRAELLKDPRTAMMSEAELETMIELLAAGAQEEGVSGRDIAWRPPEGAIVAISDAQEPACDGYPKFFCDVQRAFGFDGSNYVIPLGLLITSGLLWFLLHELRIHHRLGFLE